MDRERTNHNFYTPNYAISTSTVVAATVAEVSFDPSPMNKSSSLSKSSAVFGFFGALAVGRALPRLERMGPVLRGGAAAVDESSWLRRSAKAGFCILLRSELGALATLRVVRGGPESYAMVIGWPLARIPLNCFLALVASAGVSNEMMATPDERPLRSYLINGSRTSVPICPKMAVRSFGVIS